MTGFAWRSSGTSQGAVLSPATRVRMSPVTNETTLIRPSMISRRRYYLEAAYVDAAFGPNPGYRAPSVLTARGRQLLTEMEKSHTA